MTDDDVGECAEAAWKGTATTAAAVGVDDDDAEEETEGEEEEAGKREAEPCTFLLDAESG